MSATENAVNPGLEAALAKAVRDRSLSERVLVLLEATEASSQPFIGEKYPEILAERVRDGDRTLHRRGVTLVLLMAAFVLFANANIRELEFGGVRLTDASPIYRLLPLGIAVYYSEVLALFVFMDFQLSLLGEFLRLQYPQLVENELDFGLAPTSRISMTGALNPFIRDRGRAVWLTSALIFVATVVFFVVTPIAFLLYAFNQLKTQYGSDNLFFAVTFGLAVIFVIDGLIWLWVYWGAKLE